MNHDHNGNGFYNVYIIQHLVVRALKLQSQASQKIWHIEKIFTQEQCDQMDGLFFIHWPLTIIIWPVVWKITNVFEYQNFDKY